MNASDASNIVADSLELALDLHASVEMLQKTAAAQQVSIQERDALMEQQARVIEDQQQRLQKAAAVSEPELRQSFSVLRERGLVSSDEALTKLASVCYSDPRQLLALLVKVASNLPPLAPTPGQRRKLDDSPDSTPLLVKAAGSVVDEDLLFIQQRGLA